jgi:DNA-binding beta-propeller fold protein YncE
LTTAKRRSKFAAMVRLLGVLLVAVIGSVCRDAFSRSSRPTFYASDVVAVTAAEDGAVSVVDRISLDVLRRETSKTGAAKGRMLVVQDLPRHAFYVGNFNGGLARLTADGPIVTVDLGAPLVGMAISPDGRLLAVNGARDLVLRIMDLERFELVASASLGNPADPPKHSHLTHGLASTHPYWLPDSSAVLTEDNVHEEMLLVSAGGEVLRRLPVRSAVHSCLRTPDGEVLALAEGTVDGSVPPHVLVLRVPELSIVREIEIPLAPGEPAKLHHGALSPDGEVAFVTNMGPMHGAAAGTTVAAIRWRTGEVLWSTPTVRNAGHVAYLSPGQVLVLGHRSPELAVLDAATGARVGTWTVPGAVEMGHSLAVEPGGTALVLDVHAGRLVRVGKDGVVAASPPLGGGVTEASLPE